MNKNLVLILCLSLSFTLVGCNTDKKTTVSIQDTNKNQTLKDDLKDVNSPIQATNDQNAVNEKKDKVNSKIKLHEGTYWDERLLGDNDLNLKNSCEVIISNVTNNSFNFTVYEVDKATKNRKVIFLKNTASFTGDGMIATFNGVNHTLNFTFPSITEIRISGFKPLEGNTYLNNKIPGHECS